MLLWATWMVTANMKLFLNGSLQIPTITLMKGILEMYCLIATKSMESSYGESTWGIT